MAPKLSWSISLPDNGSIDPELDAGQMSGLLDPAFSAEGLIWWKKMEINSC